MMKIFTKKYLCAFIQILVLFSLNAASKKEGGISKIKPKSSVTLNVFDPLALNTGIQTGNFADAVYKKFNVKINIVKEAEQGQNNFDIIIWENDGEKYRQACSQKELLDWEQNSLLETWGPYLKSNFKQALLKNKFYDSPDKRMHGFAQGVGKNGKYKPLIYTWKMRSDVYEKIEKPEIDKLNDLVDIFRKMKEAEPFDSEGNPNFAAYVFNSDNGNMAAYPVALVNAYFGFDAFDFGFYDSEKGTFTDCLETDGPYLKCLKFLNQLNQAQLLTSDEKSQNNVFWNIFDGKNSGLDMITVCPKQAHPLVFCQNGYGGGAIWTIAAGTEHPELCMAIINWLSLPDGFDALCDNSCNLGVLTWSKDAFDEVDEDIYGENVEIKKNYTSLYVKDKLPKEIEKVDNLSKLIREQSWAAIFAENDEEYEKIISKMTEDANALNYSKWKDYSTEQAKKRFAAENLLK